MGVHRLTLVGLLVAGFIVCSVVCTKFPSTPESEPTAGGSRSQTRSPSPLPLPPRQPTTSPPSAAAPAGPRAPRASQPASSNQSGPWSPPGPPSATRHVVRSAAFLEVPVSPPDLYRPVTPQQIPRESYATYAKFSKPPCINATHGKDPDFNKCVADVACATNELLERGLKKTQRELHWSFPADVILGPESERFVKRIIVDFRMILGEAMGGVIATTKAGREAQVEVAVKRMDLGGMQLLYDHDRLFFDAHDTQAPKKRPLIKSSFRKLFQDTMTEVKDKIKRGLINCM